MAMGNKARFDKMQEFFEGVGEGYTGGIWEDTPTDRPKFKAKYAAQNAISRQSGGGDWIMTLDPRS